MAVVDKSLTPNKVAQGNKNAKPDFNPIPNHWHNDLCQAYSSAVHDVGARHSIIKKIHNSCSSSMIVIDSIAQTIASTDWNIVPLKDTPYYKDLARKYRNRILMSMCRRDGWDSFIHAFIEDIHVNPLGHFTQLVTDGNGFVSEFCGIGDVFPRPYYVMANERYYGIEYLKNAYQTALVPFDRTYQDVDGIWWSDERVYYLGKNGYHQSVMGARGRGDYLVGVSKAEKSRIRLWLNATLEEYFERVASGTDQSGMLVMNNLAHRAILKQLRDRKEVRKMPEHEHTNNILYVYNIGDRKGEAEWVSFRSFPADVNLLELIAVSETMVASAYGVKNWRVDSSGRNEGGGKFGNAKSAVQLDAQEPGVQWAMSKLAGLINNIVMRGLPLQFQWVGGSTATDSVRLDNLAKAVQIVSQTGGVLNVDEQRALLVTLGVPKQVIESNSGVAGSAEGIIEKTVQDVVGQAYETFASRVADMFDDFGFDSDKFYHASAILDAAIVMKHDSKCLHTGRTLELSRSAVIEKLNVERETLRVKLDACSEHNSDVMLAAHVVAEQRQKFMEVI